MYSKCCSHRIPPGKLICPFCHVSVSRLPWVTETRGNAFPSFLYSALLLSVPLVPLLLLKEHPSNSDTHPHRMGFPSSGDGILTQLQAPCYGPESKHLPYRCLAAPHPRRLKFLALPQRPFLSLILKKGNLWD